MGNEDEDQFCSVCQEQKGGTHTPGIDYICMDCIERMEEKQQQKLNGELDGRKFKTYRVVLNTKQIITLIRNEEITVNYGPRSILKIEADLRDAELRPIEHSRNDE